MQSAVTAANQVQWNKIGQAELVCIDQNLKQQGTTLQSVVQQGIAPSDPRMTNVRSLCRNQAVVQSTLINPTIGQAGAYVVDGLTLGGQVKFDSDAYRSYNCGPSEQFAGFTWCQKKTEEHVKRGQFTSSYSILHSQAGAALYINRYLEPAWFSGNEANDDINGRSKKYGTPSRIIPMPQQSSVPNGMIVTWGNVVLVPLDMDNLKQLAAGHDVRAGFMIDHIGNFQRSAKQGLPIYRLTGGAGYVWVASWDQNGIGTLRFLTVDASAINSQLSAATSNLADTPRVQAADPDSEEAAEPKTTEKDVVNRRSEELARQQIAAADTARRTADEAVKRSTAEAEAAKHSADEAFAKMAFYKKQIEDQRVRQDLILVSIAAILLISSAAGFLLFFRKRKYENAIGVTARERFTSPSFDSGSAEGNVAPEVPRDLSSIVAAVEKEILTDGAVGYVREYNPSDGRLDLDVKAQNRSKLAEPLDIAEANRSGVPQGRPAKPEPVGTNDLVDQLVKFAELRANGTLTEQEFQELKSNIIGDPRSNQLSNHDRIKHLRSLRDSGKLTEDEFHSRVLASLSN